jgi:hypothetical protein
MKDAARKLSRSGGFISSTLKSYGLRMFTSQAFLRKVELSKQFKNASTKHSTSFRLFVIDEFLVLPSSKSKGKGGLIAPGN